MGREKDGIVVKKPTLTLKNKKKRWFFYPRKKKKQVRRSNFGDACGSWEEHNKSSCHSCTWLLLFNDDADNRHRKSQKKERKREM
jgi:hypothetical protein